MLGYTMHAQGFSLLVILSCLTAAVAASCSNISYYIVAPDGDPCRNSLSTCRELSFITSFLWIILWIILLMLKVNIVKCGSFHVLWTSAVLKHQQQA